MSSAFNYLEASERNAKRIAELEAQLAELEAQNSRLTRWYLNYYQQMCDAQAAAGRLQAQLADALAQLERREEWEKVEEYSASYVLADDGQAYTIGVDGDGAGYVFRRSDKSVVYLPDSWQLMRRVPGGAKEATDAN